MNHLQIITRRQFPSRETPHVLLNHPGLCRRPEATQTAEEKLATVMTEIKAGLAHAVRRIERAADPLIADDGLMSDETRSACQLAADLAAAIEIKGLC